jgi:hypothetical protein
MNEILNGISLENQSGGQNPNNINPNNKQYIPYYPMYPMVPSSNYMLKKPEERDASKLAYNITIDIELYPGKSLTSSQISELKCSGRYNAVRKAYADFVGKPYVIPPVYTRREQTKKTGGRRTRKINNK